MISSRLSRPIGTPPAHALPSGRWPLAVLSLGLALATIALGCSQDGPTTGPGGPPGGGPPGAGGQRQGPPPVPVLVAQVRRSTIPIEVSTVGSLRSPETTVVSSDVSGILVELNAPEGREIPRGHLVARVDDQEAKAALQVAEARAKNARIALDRASPLVRDGVVPQQTLDNADAEMSTAEGLLEEAKTRLEKTRIRAPFAGRVGIQTAQRGQYVSSGDAIIELTRLDPLELIFGVPEEQAASVATGQKVQGRVGRCGEAFEAIVQAIDPQVDRQSRTLTVQAKVNNQDRKLIPGMSARVRLVIGELTDTLAVPREALVAQGTRYLVWVVDAEGTASPRPVTPGRYLPDVVEIREGLEGNETIIVAGHQKTRPGAKVAPSPWEPTVNPTLALGSRAADDCDEPI